MKKLISLSYALLVTLTAFAQTPSQDQNYVTETTVKVDNKKNATDLNGLTSGQVNKKVTYLDGLGRPVQVVDWQASPAGKDLIQPIEYDALGRETKKYLPYTSTGTNGSFKSNAISNQNSFYNAPPAGVGQLLSVNGVTPSFAETSFEASPLNRVLQQGAPGAVWQLDQNHTVKMAYGTNNANDVRLYRANPVTTAGLEHQRTLTLTSGSEFYLPATLYLSIIKDENWKDTDLKAGTTEEFKDKDGRVVLKRSYNQLPNATIETLSTYYVYDDLGNLSFVLPPGADPDASIPSQTVLDNLCYQYRYDHRKRLIEKKIPGKDWEEMLYNKLDQIVGTRDANQRTLGQWLFNKYDALGRVIITGIANLSLGRSDCQNAVDGQSSFWEIRDDTNSSETGTGYSNSTLPFHTMVAQYLTINYYDDYAIFGLPPGVSGYNNRTNGLLTCTKTEVLSSPGTHLWAVYCYDDDGRNYKTYQQHYLEGLYSYANYDVTTKTYYFSGADSTSTRQHFTIASTSTPAVTITNRYEYDHMGRKTKTFEKINSDPEVELSNLNYNELGQLKEKQVHNNLQSTAYTYNPRGWLKTSTSGQFSMQLDYEDGTTPQYNGNISNQLWGPTSTPNANTFSYSYDKLNRLLSGAATGMSETLIYDKMGNISSLKRDTGTLNSYAYTNGNQLNKITGALNTGVYLYDANGNATYDGRTAKTITYNVLNLLQTISGGITYTYDASGRKLRKKVVTTSTTTTTDYINGIQYTNGAIEFIQTEEGLARRNSENNYSYEYNLKDHLGNTRATFYKNPTTLQLEVLQRDDYYPFGMKKDPPVLAGSNTNKYLYNGKELQEETGQYDYGARFYDPVIARWTTPDPLAEKYRRWSPYNYCVNNPIRVIDPDGMDIVYVDKQGKEVSRTESKTNEVYLRQLNSTAIDNPSGYSNTKVTISMSYSGDMASDNDKRSVGSLALNATDENGNVTKLSSYSADSGPSGVGSIPNGDYTASGIVNTTEEGMVRDGVGFKVILSGNSEKCRTDLRVHPDGVAFVGTAGCIGLTEQSGKLNDFKGKMESLLKDGSTINVNVAIKSNPNLSDCDVNGKKISKGGAAGN